MTVLSSLSLATASDAAEAASTRLKELYLLHPGADSRLLRAELILEEAAEVCQALSQQDEVKLLDGLADLLYVTLGTAVAYDLPLAAAFAEVHRSNMTKGQAAAAHSGDRGKGEGFSPADLLTVLKVWRAS